MEEHFEKKDFIQNLLAENAREMFKFRSRMFNVKWNYKSDPKYSSDLWKCSSCQSAIETQNHVLFCPAYSTLREGKDVKNDKDLTDYLKQVLKIRDKLNFTK